MWQCEKVERALFRWRKWRQSILGEWVTLSELEKLPLGQLKLRARDHLTKLNLPNSSWLQLYWICCVFSGYTMDSHTSYDKILVPAWLRTPFERKMDWQGLGRGSRMYPPVVWDHEDLKFYARQYGGFNVWEQGLSMRFVGLQGEYIKRIVFPNEFDSFIIISCKHELHQILNGLRGRPKKSDRIGGQTIYSDRLAVKCAVMKDNGSTYVEIAQRFGLAIKEPLLPTTKSAANDPDLVVSEDPYVSKQSDTARHLVNRGKKLLDIFGESPQATSD